MVYTHRLEPVSGTIAVPVLVRPLSNLSWAMAGRTPQPYAVTAPLAQGDAAVMLTMALVAPAGTRPVRSMATLRRAAILPWPPPNSADRLSYTRVGAAPVKPAGVADTSGVPTASAVVPPRARGVWHACTSDVSMARLMNCASAVPPARVMWTSSRSNHASWVAADCEWV